MKTLLFLTEWSFGRDRPEGHGDHQRSRACRDNGRSRFTEKTRRQTIRREQSIRGRMVEEYSPGKLRRDFQEKLVHGHGTCEMRVGGRIGDRLRDPEASSS